jgi:hypothetical protein
VIDSFQAKFLSNLAFQEHYTAEQQQFYMNYMHMMQLQKQTQLSGESSYGDQHSSGVNPSFINQEFYVKAFGGNNQGMQAQNCTSY